MHNSKWLDYQQESRRAYGTAVRRVVVHLNKIHLNHSRILTLHWPQHNIYVNRHTQLQTKVTLFFPVHSSHRLQK